MTRLIDVDKMLEEMEENEPMNWTNSESEIQEVSDYRYYYTLIDTQPIVDAVAVVRCRDCAYRKNNHKCPMCHAVYNNGDEYILDFASDDFFCYNGKKWGMNYEYEV